MIEEMLLTAQAQEGGKVSRTLIKGPDVAVVLTVLPKGHELKLHRAAAQATVVALQGEVTFSLEGKEATVSAKGSRILALGRDEPHAVRAVANSALLLVLGPVHHESREGG